MTMNGCPFLLAIILMSVISLPAQANGFKMEYRPPKNPRYSAIQQDYMATKLLEGPIADLNQRLNLPNNIPVSFEECGAANAYYSPNEKRILICFEIVDLFTFAFAPELLPDDAISFDQKFKLAVKGANQAILDAQKMRFGSDRLIAKKPDPAFIKAAQKKIKDAIVFVFYHEAGHALVHNLNLPITGKEEDAVDQLASYIMIGKDLAGQRAATNAAAAFLSFDPGFFSLFSKSTFADEHSLAQQRFFNILCWVYGSNESRWSTLVSAGTLPSARAVRCPHEYQQLAGSWETLLGPYSRPTYVRAVAAFLGIDAAPSHVGQDRKENAGTPNQTDKVVTRKSGSEMFMGRAGTQNLVQAAKAEQRKRAEDRYPTEGDLGAIRAAIAIYSGDHDGKPPVSLDDLTAEGKYLTVVPGRKYLLYDSKEGEVSAKPQ